jgi:hypothetical protein
MTATAVLTRPLGRIDLPKDPQRFSEFAIPFVRALLERSGGHLESGPTGFGLVAAELGTEESSVTESFLHRATNAGLLKVRGRWYKAGDKLPTESLSERLPRCRRVRIPPEPTFPQGNSIRQRGIDRRPRRRSRR